MNPSDLLGFLLGGSSAAYIYLHSDAIGFAFPNINRQHSVRPTISRVALYLSGRWLGYLGIGWIGSSIGFWIYNIVLQRLAWCADIFFGLFMIIFVITANSPELKINRFFNPAWYNLPVFIIGNISVIAGTAPFFIALLQLIHTDSGYEGMLFFTNVFIGNAVVSLPILLNIKWNQSLVYKFLLRAILAITGVSVLFLNIHDLLNS